MKLHEFFFFLQAHAGIFIIIIIIIITLFTHGVQFTYRGLPWSRVLLLLTNFEFKTI